MNPENSPQTCAVRWNADTLTLEQRRTVNGRAQWMAFEKLPDISGLKVQRDPCLPMLNLTSISKCAQAAKQQFEHATPTRQQQLVLDIQAWNFTWRCIKRSRPALAALLQDEQVKAICAACDGQIMIEA